MLNLTREPVVQLAEHTDPERLKERLPYLLNPERMNKHLIEMWSKVGGRFGSETETALKNAKSGIPVMEWKEDSRQLELWENRMKAYAAERSLKKAKKILTTEQEAINNLIDQVIEQAKTEGMGIPETRRLMQDVLKGDEMVAIENYQAERIARTEVGSASNTASFQAAMENPEGVTKGWLISGLKNMRESHIFYGSMGDLMPMNYEYNTGLKFPQDPDCPLAEDVINCRCTIIYNVDN